MEKDEIIVPPTGEGSRDEKRSEHRRRVLKSGTLYFNRGFNSFGCRIRNLTDSGAMIEMGETTGVPHQVDFQSDGIGPVKADIIWRTQNRMGLQFGQ